jgi:hypothetical protein
MLYLEVIKKTDAATSSMRRHAAGGLPAYGTRILSMSKGCR